jgi:hypothetical protein
MEGLTIKLIIFSYIGDGIQVYLMSDRSGEQTMILITLLVVAKVRERLAVSKQTTRIFHMEKFNLKKLNEVEAKEKYGIEISNRFAEVDINY